MTYGLRSGLDAGRQRLATLAMTAGLATAAVGCLTPAAERAARDDGVGQAETTDWQVEVTDGLAAVLSAEVGQLRLWQSAPSIEWELEVTVATRLELRVDNVMPSARLRSVEGALSFSADENPAATSATYFVDIPSAGRYRLNHGPEQSSVPAPFRFALLSDVQEAVDEVRDVFERVNQETDLDFLLGAGDLTEGGSRDELQRFKAELQVLNVPYYTTLGNHELGESPPPYQELFGRGSLSFEHRGARFTLLDSASAMIDARVFGWLDDWMALGRDRLHVVAMHIPPVDPVGVRNGSFASRAEANKLLGRLLRGGVDLTLYGHIHTFYSFENAGIPALISGGGGAIPQRFDGLGRHYVIVAVDPIAETLTHQLVRVD